MMALRLEFSGQDHPVGHELERISRKLIRQAMAYAKKQREKGRRVKPLTMSYATLARIGGPSSPGYYTVKKLKIKP